MKVTHIKIRKADTPLTVMDSFVDRGLTEGGHASLPDIDVDYASDRRQEIKDYLEERYNVDGRQRVFSAGTFTTMKLKAALKDVARVHRVPHAIVNYITAMIDDGTDWTGLFIQATTNRKLREFIQTYPEVIEDVRGLLGQPKAASIHASAIIVTPDARDGRPAECFDYLPVRKMDGALVSEFDGYSVDEIGLLKEDVLATKELAKLSAVIALANSHFGQELSIGRITQEMLEDGKTYRLLAEGNTQNVFQFSSPGITRFIQDVRPKCIEDLIAINALYRPATLDIGATEDYIRFRRGEVAPVYDYGCYEATKNTFGIMCYQEQFMSIAHTLGGFDLGMERAGGDAQRPVAEDDDLLGAVGRRHAHAAFAAQLVGRALDVGVGSLSLFRVDDLDAVHRLHTAGVALDLIGVEHDDDAALAKALIVGENVDQRAARRGDILRGELLELVPREDDIVAVDEQIFRVL